MRGLTVAELSRAVHTDGSNILDFQRSILDLCHGFVTIDNGGNVVMIHQTAREYLLNAVDHPFHIDRKFAHKQLFLSCMRTLTAVGLRAQARGNHIADFLDYAVKSWSYHLSSTPLDCEQTVETLCKFLTGHWVLTWIHLLATKKQLRILIQSSKHLLKYASKIKDYNENCNERHFNFAEQVLIESWADDFMKIPGKFGRILHRNPESIYKLIAPFCPQNTAIYHQFGKMKDKAIVVSGLSAENWDDSLARISLGLGDYASSISAAGTRISILTSSGNTLIYDSSTFEELIASPIRHGERVYRIQLNSTGALLATYGYRSTRIWEVSTGKCKLSVDNIDSRPRPLALLFIDNSTTLMVGTDDKRIRLLDLSQDAPAWQLTAELEEPELDGHFLNSSNLMALNNDGTLIAVAYRGHPLSAWEIDGPVHVGHCWRKREEAARGEVIEAFWHPHSPEILGLYIEGVVFIWHPYDDEICELATGASRLAISGDGNLFATGDVRGTVKVFTTSDFHLLYQLASEDSVLSLAFSPDLHRFYDIRGYYANVWEPNALLRFAEQRAKGFEGESESGSLAQNAIVSESKCWRIDAITALAVSPIGRLYCCGTEKGLVHLHDVRQGQLTNLHTSKSFLSIEQMAWSDDGRHLCFSDSTKKLVIISFDTSIIHIDRLAQKKAEIPMKSYISGPLVQILFHPDSDRVLIRSFSTICVVSIAMKKVISSFDLDTARSRLTLDPQGPSSIIDVGPNAIRVVDWRLTAMRTYNIQGLHPQSIPTDSEAYVNHWTVDRVLLTWNKTHALVQISSLSQNQKGKTLFAFELASLVEPTELSPNLDKSKISKTIRLLNLSPALTAQISVPMGFLSHDKLIYISQDFQICSARCTFHSASSLSNQTAVASTDAMQINRQTSNNSKYESSQHKVQSLFSLPGDWISRHCLNLTTIWNVERSFLCPKNGEVAVVRCAALV